MHCTFSGARASGESIQLDRVELPKVNHFRYLGSIIQQDGNIDEDVTHRIQSGWLKWRSATGVLCDHKVPTKLKGKFYRTAIRPVMLYGSECWAVKQQHTQKMCVAEMRMLRWMCGNTRKDRIRNEFIRDKVGVASVDDKMREGRLRWFGHVNRRHESAPVRMGESMQVVGGKRGRGRPKLTWSNVVKKDMVNLNIPVTSVTNRAEWRRLIHIADPA